MATESVGVQIDASLLERAARIADSEGRSVESLIEDLLRRRVSSLKEYTGAEDVVDESPEDRTAEDASLNEVWDRMNRSLQDGPDLGFGDSRAA
ncbi:hypothetical protein CRI94_04585 [Longibacter salinarum]|uniref:Uncharacterized protein n=1 Tax=Longibacter salinarum TaxID=1850348 RepID=A0A2A8D011_9BACT|nr:hypothetical protein [Longibacter salinarum]PEN14319.1 hypothetical protein CRI94_04585 [Longibacter salinarum]